MTKTVHLGFTLGSGEPVTVPLNHMVITGQTQMAGKTTALEALVARSRVKAIAFVTKRGEGSFANARVIPPYFREEANWHFVASILEASRGEKMRFERAWIMRASKGAQSLADVQRNVRRLMEKSTRGMDADMYMVLDAYLEIVVPQIDRVQWAKRVELSAGLSVMDLTALNVEMQHLVIRSTIDWVLNHESNTVVVVPEAWKFIPQGRGTPVKLAAEAYIRQAAGLGNYLWLDSQDIAGVEKIILKSVPIWVLGVQRESNEVKRTLAQIPAGMRKPKPEQIATLGLGQFIVCYGTEIDRVYAQPAWMAEKDARDVALGKVAVVATAPTSPLRTFMHRGMKAQAAVNEIIDKEPQVNQAEADALRAENRQLREQLEALQRRVEGVGATAVALAPARDRTRDGPPVIGDVARGEVVRSGGNGDVPELQENRDGINEVALYEAFRARMLAEDPAPILRLLKARPELVVEIERKTVTMDGTTVKGRVAKLLADGFFATGQRPGAVRAELVRTGKDVNVNTLQAALVDLVVDGFLTNEGSGRYKHATDALVRVIDK